MVTHWLLLIAITAAPAESAEPASGNGTPAHEQIDFGRDIRPILSRRCTQCHGSADQEAGLDFSTRETALAELDSGERAVVPGDR
ncbi:MAG: c-type cytochrome domain-containing protein, partial [Planctomycetota bacterium]|nr:c-type cytochrome domain-containing protein [Planctomycetota bacterium]